MEHTQETKSTQTIRYQDCLLGKVGTPKEKKRKNLFQITAIAVSIPFTATINWMFHASSITWSEFSQYLYLYPITFAIALLVRFLVANPVSDKVTKEFISPRLEGLKKVLSITILNIIIMGTLIGLGRTILLAASGESAMWASFIASLPLSCLISFIFGYLVTTPLLKKVFLEKTEDGIRSRRIKHPHRSKLRHA